MKYWWYHFANIGGISYHDDSVLHRNGLGKRIQKLEDVDSPYLIGLFDDMKVPDNYVLNAVMENDRGCPYRCNFCVWPSSMTNNDPDGTSSRKVRQYSPDLKETYN